MNPTVPAPRDNSREARRLIEHNRELALQTRIVILRLALEQLDPVRDQSLYMPLFGTLIADTNEQRALRQSMAGT